MIPRGMVSTYGAVARAAGLPGRARLTGFALKAAPEELNLPWHRVVGAGGRIVFPKTSLQHREQARRLRAERVPVKDGLLRMSKRSDAQARSDLAGQARKPRRVLVLDPKAQNANSGRSRTRHTYSLTNEDAQNMRENAANAQKCSVPSRAQCDAHRGAA
jgi:methylated-DNA-protein-cysteine methyltransferase related protein